MYIHEVQTTTSFKMASLSSWSGVLVKLNCGVLGTFQGRVAQVDSSCQTLVLSDAIHDGRAVEAGEVSVRAADIQGLDIVDNIEKSVCTKSNQRVPDTKPAQSVSKSGKPSKNKQTSNTGERLTPKKEGKLKSFREKDQECFVESVEGSGIPNFDFEKNLALFDKKAVFEQLESSGAVSNVLKQKEQKIKHDEHVLEQEPVALKQIVVPAEQRGKEFFTDEGITVPSVSLELRQRLFETSERMGLTQEQRTESVGLCTSQMALQLLGGSRRLNISSSHKMPCVVVMAGPHQQGIYAICAARHLANHNVQVILFIPKKTQALIAQLALFMHSGGKLVSSVAYLPSHPVDLVIDGLVGYAQKPEILEQMLAAVSWANQNKAPVLALDPCLSARALGMEVKWSVGLALPLDGTPSSGQLYLADVGIPKGVFSSVGITYVSPFADKFVIPLNP